LKNRVTVEMRLISDDGNDIGNKKDS